MPTPVPARHARSPRRLARGAAIACLAVVALVVAACEPAPPAPEAAKPASGLSIKVAGKDLVDASGQVVQLRGVNRPGTEYRCAQDPSYYGFITDDSGTDGKTVAYAAKAIEALKSWNKPGAAGNAINTVRIPMNEDCWLGINGVPSAYSGANYQRFIAAEVDAATAAGMYVILDLHWSAPGSFLATQQDVGPNADHSIAFWREVATAYKDQPSVVFDLINEPRLWCSSAACNASYTTASQTAWGCYRDGCTYTYTADDHVTGRTSGQIKIAGSQQLVDEIRAAGATNVILIEGLGYANALDLWTAYKPKDPAQQIAAELHTYPSSGANVNNKAWLDDMLSRGGLSTTYPIVVGEFGEGVCNASSTGFTQQTMDWADSHGYSYAAWGWDSGEGCSGPTLVTRNDAGSASTYGAVVKAHLQSKQG
ncbi:glycoside hydrolase family 5 protein [Aquihabitans sp. McL0605]|uniref:glycoside hydrolase family 5 protein n=1 Tax=Aquihabitans sp. McL0605 TaxID=3415671 RepID=UPI003CF4A5CF